MGGQLLHRTAGLALPRHLAQQLLYAAIGVPELLAGLIQTLHHSAGTGLQLGIRLMDTAQEQVAVPQQLVDAAADLLGAVALLGVDLPADNVHQQVGDHIVRYQQRRDGDGGNMQPEGGPLFDHPEE